jgi:acetyltransferase-like isoleucine patch superfamily enzyme
MYGRNISVQSDFSLSFDLSASTVQLASDNIFRKSIHIVSGKSGTLKIGNNNFFNNNCSINCFCKIEIGNNCQFGESVKLYDHNHIYKNANLLINEQGYSIGEIKIGNNCWIGSNVVILKNVTIGNNVVIGAGAVIFESIEDNTLVINKQGLIMKRIISS